MKKQCGSLVGSTKELERVDYKMSKGLMPMIRKTKHGRVTCECSNCFGSPVDVPIEIPEGDENTDATLSWSVRAK